MQNAKYENFLRGQLGSSIPVQCNMEVGLPTPPFPVDSTSMS